MASGLSMPVGFKNGTDGSLGVAINAMIAASRQHSFLGIDGAGRVGVVRTAGNPQCHIVLRGGAAGPNYAGAQVQKAVSALAQANVNPRVLIDASHDNSYKDPLKQPAVLSDVGEQIRRGQSQILGVMLESHLLAGRQELVDKASLVYGQSITDGCLGFEATEAALEAFADDVRSASGLSAAG
jgi:3-deoxy-7-phosphoheptulonate synthase